MQHKDLTAAGGATTNPNLEEISFDETPLALRSYLYTNKNFPCLVKNGATIEDVNGARSEDEKYRIIARNGLRHLTYGTSLYESGLIRWDIIKALGWERDEHLFDALRKEMQNIFSNAYLFLENKQIDAEGEKRMEIFINNLLAAYPYMDPSENEKVFIPQKIGEEWQFTEFSFQKIDISPQDGLLSRFIDDRDRLYAYGLVPVTEKAASILILMGSHYPSGQGADLNWLYNFAPMQSVGEGHDLSSIERWLEEHAGAKITGHSKGGTLAMILAALYPEFISEANCLNPALLSNFTINRLHETLKNKIVTHKPTVNVFIQVNDPVFLLGYHVLEGSVVYRIGDKAEHYSPFEAHINYFTGRKSTLIESISKNELESSLQRREFVADIKEALNWAVFPVLYSRLIYKLSLRRVEDVHATHPVAKAFFKPVKVLADVSSSFVFLGVLTATTITAVSIGAVCSGIKLGLKALQGNTSPPSYPVGHMQETISESTVSKEFQNARFIGSTTSLAKQMKIDTTVYQMAAEIPLEKDKPSLPPINPAAMVREIPKIEITITDQQSGLRR